MKFIILISLFVGLNSFAIDNPPAPGTKPVITEDAKDMTLVDEGKSKGKTKMKKMKDKKIPVDKSLPIETD